MAKIRSKTLTCPNCGSAVPVRNIFKAKVVVCPNCDSQLDLTSPDFQVLGTLPARMNPQDAICLGLKGALEDGRTFETIGRIRYSEYDDEESWFWDEWLLLAENGEYLWLTEDGKKFELLTKFIPEAPPDIDTLKTSRVLNIDGTEYRVKEKGTPSISYVEGELTWRATIGDTSSYIDARGPGGGFTVEFNAEEIEFFKRKKMGRVETYRLVGLESLLELEAARDKKRIEYQKGPKAMGCGGYIMAAGALLAFLLFVVFAAIGGKPAEGKTSTLDATTLSTTTVLGKANLAANSDYVLSFDSLVHPATTTAELAIVDPKGTSHVVLKVNNLQKTGEADLQLNFQAEYDGEHRLTLTGIPTTNTAVATSTSPAITAIKWYFRSEPLHGEGFFFIGPLLLIGGLLMFIVSAGRMSAASLRAAREFRKERNALIEELRQKSRVQES